ncbi:hypothetical protein L7L29_003065 [Klebsiella pneumoniae]|nr:hypothetical protein [Klebsiella pneumoniae]EKW3944092.1 hypothetical protein [Klebsiella pneumoniae]
MTDITELALRLKLEVHLAVSNFNPQMNIKTRDLNGLVEALEKAQSRDVTQAAKDYHFDQQADRIAELDAELEREREKTRRVMSRIAELESRAVKLPQRHSMLLREDFSEDYHTEMAYKADEVQASLAAVGIKVEAE